MKDDPPRLPTEIAEYGASILKQWGNIKGFLNELRVLAGDDERMLAPIAGIRSAGIFIGEDCARLQAAVGAAGACGYIAGPMQAQDMELHPANRHADDQRNLPYHDRMMDAAGDHTTDREEGA